MTTVTLPESVVLQMLQDLDHASDILVMGRMTAGYDLPGEMDVGFAILHHRADLLVRLENAKRGEAP